MSVMIHKVDLQALCDVVWQVREVFPVLRWQNDAGHTSTTGSNSFLFDSTYWQYFAGQ